MAESYTKSIGGGHSLQMLSACPACRRFVRSSDLVCPFCRRAPSSARVRLAQGARAARREIALAIALGACGGVVEPLPHMDAATPDAAADSRAPPSFSDASIPVPRDASHDAVLPQPVYGAPPPPPED